MFVPTPLPSRRWVRSAYSPPSLPPRPAAPRCRVRLGPVDIDALAFAESVDAIEALVDGGVGGSVFFPNVDHIITAERDPAFFDAYASASLCLVDGAPVVWAARLLGTPLPEKVSGADVLLPLMERAAVRRWRVFLAGGEPEVAQQAARVLRSLGVNVVGVDSPRIGAVPGEGDESAAAAARIADAAPDLVLVAFGSPAQELWIHRSRAQLGPAVAVAAGASLGFVAGTLRRAPSWMSRVGLEWVWRLGQEPRLLWRRYLVNDPRFVLTVARAFRTPRARRIIQLP